MWVLLCSCTKENGGLVDVMSSLCVKFPGTFRVSCWEGRKRSMRSVSRALTCVARRGVPEEELRAPGRSMTLSWRMRPPSSLMRPCPLSCCWSFRWMASCSPTPVLSAYFMMGLVLLHATISKKFRAGPLCSIMHVLFTVSHHTATHSAVAGP